MAKAKVKAEKPVTTLRRNFWADDRKIGYLLGALAFLLYVQTVGFDYALDDRAVLFANDFVKEGFGGFGKILTTFYWDGYWDDNAGLFRPVSLLLFAIEWQIMPDSPGFYHFVHVILLSVLCMQLFRFLRELFKDYGVTLPLLAAIIWMVMPIHTEVGANLKSADEILSLLFSVLGFRSLLKWRDKNKTFSLYFSAFYFFLALLSKEGAALMLPIALLMLLQFRGMTIKQLIKPGVLLLGISLVWFGYHYAVVHSAPTEKITYDYHHNALYASDSKITQIGTAIAIQGRYIAKMIIGYPLSYNYSFNEIPVNGFADAWAIAALLLIGGGLTWAILNLKKNPVPSFGILFYLIAFALTSNIFYLIGETMGDRLAFVPSLGFAILIAWFILKLTKGLDVSGIHPRAISVSAVAILIWAGLTLIRSQVWAYESTLFTADVEHAPNSARVHYNYGVLLMGDAQKETLDGNRIELLNRSYVEFTTAYAIDSMDIQSCVNLGVVEYRRKNYKESVKWSLRTMQIMPGYTGSHENIGDAYMMTLQYDSAGYYYRELMRATDTTAPLLVKLGNSRLGAKDTLDAIRTYEFAGRVDSTSLEAWNKLGNLAGMSRDYAKSNVAFEHIARLFPEDPNPWKMIYTNYQAMGDSIGAGNAAREYYKRGGK
jgi:protein O-mannosyl-transferase